jgi:hypothetical protein
VQPGTVHLKDGAESIPNTSGGCGVGVARTSRSLGEGQEGQRLPMAASWGCERLELRIQQRRRSELKSAQQEYLALAILYESRHSTRTGVRQYNIKTTKRKLH